MDDQTLSSVPARDWHDDLPEEITQGAVETLAGPTEHANLKIKTLGTKVEVRGTVPLMVCVAGIIGAIATEYIAAYSHTADLGWFLGLAAGHLALAGVVIFRLTSRGRKPQNRKAIVLPAERLPLPESLPAAAVSLPIEASPLAEESG